VPLTPPAGSLPPDYFEAIYDRDLDPWRFATSEYERRKYDRTLAAIGDRPIGRAWEVGCSIGVFTRRLAARCGAVLAVDVAEAALREAGARCAGLPNVTFRRQHVPQEWPEGKFDLIVFSEMLYYLSPADIARTARRATAGLAPQGRIVLVHWTGSTNYPCSGDEAAETFCTAASPELAVRLTERHKRYRIDVLTAHRAMGANATLDMPDED
jgi:cyclopropane fatty-acyl-phospholipid synthase-like methyltransferase